MSSRISCWLHGHKWGRWGAGRGEDLFGNYWELRFCDQCRASQRRCISTPESRLETLLNEDGGEER